MMVTPKKTLIVGQGIAGTLLAFRLFQQGIPFKIVDAGAGAKSSAIASGLINPVVVKHFGLSWMAREIVPEAAGFYRLIEETIQETFYHPLEIFRVFQQDNQRDLWNKRRQEEQATDFMRLADEMTPDGINAPHGGAYIQNAAWVNTDLFMQKTTGFFEQNNLIAKENFDFAQFHPTEKGWNYKEEKFDLVIFCQGVDSKDNPWFDWIPIIPLKGQLIKIKHRSLSREQAISKKIFILPVGENEFKIGATFERTLEQGNTEEGVNFLKEKFAELVDYTDGFEISDHYFGFRPTVPDRRPILGSHPQQNNLFLFNGLGSKGYMLAPWLSGHLFEHIYGRGALLPEIHIGRFYHLREQLQKDVR